jgi:hypothetical protein
MYSGVKLCEAKEVSSTSSIDLLTIYIPLEGHFDVYPGHEGFDRAVHAQLDFIRRHAPV